MVDERRIGALRKKMQRIEPAKLARQLSQTLVFFFFFSLSSLRVPSLLFLSVQEKKNRESQTLSHTFYTLTFVLP